MKNKGWIVLVILIVMIAVSLAMYDNEPHIGVYIYDMSDFYMTTYVMHLSNALKDVGEVHIHDAKNSQILQNEAILGQIDQMDILLVNPVDRLSSYALIELAERKDKTIIFFNREPLKSDLEAYKSAFYVGSKAIQSAEYQADLIAQLYGNNPNDLNDIDKNNDNKIQLLIFKGQRGHQDAEDRTKYLKQYLIAYGYDIDVIDIKTADWNKQKAKTLMAEVLNNQTYVEVVACNNDYMALGVVEAVEEFKALNSEAGDIKILGIDGMNEAIEAVKAGKMYGTVFNDAQSQAIAVSNLAKDELEGLEDVENTKYIWVDYALLNIEHE
ncbi:MAG: hypothetical protein EOM59_08375 [Clostridia bacterium]|nr:hypothetical protein [Clostridia bacterium]